MNMGKDTQERLDYIAAYQKENTFNLNIRLSKIYDADIIDELDKQKNKAGFIKELIRNHIEKKG